MLNQENHFDQYELLIKAIRNGNKKSICTILEEGYDINTFPQDKPSALSIAVFSCDLDVIKLLLSCGADTTLSGNRAVRYAFDRSEEIIFAVLKRCPNLNLLIENHNATPLHVAVWKGLLSVVEYLLKNGADPNMCTMINKKTVLLLACENNATKKNNTEIVRILLEYGAHINQKDELGNVPLLRAAFVGNENIVKLLIEHGADLTARNHKGFTALHGLLDKEFITEEIIQLFLDSGINVNDKSENGTCLLSIAVANQRSEPFEYLLKCGADINNLRETGNECLLRACFKGHLKTVEIVLNSGLNNNINTKGKLSRQTVLHNAVHNAICATEIVKLLLKHGANVNSIDASESTPLLEAFTSGSLNKEMIKLLLIHGADVNVKDGDELTPLHQASEENFDEVISELLYFGADINAKVSIDSEEITPLSIIAERVDNLSVENKSLYFDRTYNFENIS